MGRQTDQMTQKEMVREHLKVYRTITPMEAITLYSITRLAAIIYDLKKEGLNITTTLVSGENRWGQKRNWAEYKLERKDEKDG